MSEQPSAKQYFDVALQAYREGQFNEAISAFQQGLQLDKNAWEMRLYLGMAHARLGNSREAKQEFLSVRDFASDPEMRKKANAAFQALTPSASQQGVRKLNG
jgi:Flp pilus assembly protein TadD